jgi:hypothetical protein
MAVHKVVPSSEALLTGNYKDIKIKLLEGKYEIYFNENVSRKTQFHNVFSVIK